MGHIVIEQTGRPERVNHPAHYQTDGPECIEVIELLGWGREFCLGNALKYLWRAGRKGGKTEDLEKARWYLDRLIQHPAPSSSAATAATDTAPPGPNAGRGASTTATDDGPGLI